MLPPQKLLGHEYSGEKADIFSLGCILFTLVLGKYCFNKPIIYEKINEYVQKKDKDNYFAHLITNSDASNSLTNEFKDLHFRMIAYEEDDRPNNIEEILDDHWFDEIRDLSPEKQKELEDKVKEKFKEKITKVDYFLKINPHLFDEVGYASSSNRNKNFSKEETHKYPKYFKPNFILKEKNIKLNGEYYIKLLGNFDYCEFMNKFVNEIKQKYKNEFINIDEIKTNFKCNIEFQRDEEDNEKDLIIKLHLYRSGDEELTLRFLRKDGDKHEFNEKVLDFISIAKEIQ